MAYKKRSFGDRQNKKRKAQNCSEVSNPGKTKIAKRKKKQTQIRKTNIRSRQHARLARRRTGGVVLGQTHDKQWRVHDAQRRSKDSRVLKVFRPAKFALSVLFFFHQSCRVWVLSRLRYGPASSRDIFLLPFWCWLPYTNPENQGVHGRPCWSQQAERCHPVA